jgi:hypothetical protein
MTVPTRTVQFLLNPGTYETTGPTVAPAAGTVGELAHTVKFLFTNTYRKLGVTNRASAVRVAHEDELITKEAAHADVAIDT